MKRGLDNKLYTISCFTPTILGLFFLDKHSTSFHLLDCEWIVDSTNVNLSCREEQVCCTVSVSSFRSMKSFHNSRY